MSASVSLLAPVVLAIHFLFVVFVVAGGALVLRWPRLVWAHLAALTWGAGIEFLGGVCPLTILEQHLREHSASRYQGGCVDHYLTAVVYPSGLTREIQIALGLSVLVLNAGIYALVLRRRRHARARRAI